MLKKICSTHRYWFEGNECPFCQSERLKKFAAKLHSQTRPITEIDLNKLQEKFSNLR